MDGVIDGLDEIGEKLGAGVVGLLLGIMDGVKDGPDVTGEIDGRMVVGGVGDLVGQINVLPMEPEGGPNLGIPNICPYSRQTPSSGIVNWPQPIEIDGGLHETEY